MDHQGRVRQPLRMRQLANDRQNPGALLPRTLREELLQPGERPFPPGGRGEVWLPTSCRPLSGEQRTEAEGGLGPHAVRVERLADPADPVQLVLQVAPRERRRQEPERAESGEAPANVESASESRPVSGRLGPPVKRRSGIGDGEELLSGDGSRIAQRLEDHGLEGAGLHRRSRFRGDQEHGLRQAARHQGLPHRCRREAIEELHFESAAPGKSGDERLRGEARAAHRDHHEAFETLGEQFLAEPDVCRVFPAGGQRQVHPAEPVLRAAGAGRPEPAGRLVVGPGRGLGLGERLQRAHRHSPVGGGPKAPGHGVCRRETRRNRPARGLDARWSRRPARRAGVGLPLASRLPRRRRGAGGEYQ